MGKRLTTVMRKDLLLTGRNLGTDPERWLRGGRLSDGTGRVESETVKEEKERQKVILLAGWPLCDSITLLLLSRETVLWQSLLTTLRRIAAQFYSILSLKIFLFKCTCMGSFIFRRDVQRQQRCTLTLWIFNMCKVHTKSSASQDVLSQSVVGTIVSSSLLSFKLPRYLYFLIFQQSFPIITVKKKTPCPSS